MEKVENTKLDDIQVPEGLEARLLSKIDLWAQAERQERDLLSRNHPFSAHGTRFWLRAAAAAAVIAVIITGAMIIKPRTSALADTYDDSRQAYIKTVSTLNMLSETLTMGKDEIETLDLFGTPADSITSSTLKVLSE